MFAFPAPAFPAPTYDAPQAAGPVKPDTPRRASRRRELKETLGNLAVGPEEAATLRAGARAEFAAEGAWQAWLVEQVGGLMARISQVERAEQSLRDWTAYRALDCWDDDQKLAAETLGLKLARTPGKVVAELRASAAGCDWLLARWRALARVGAPDWTDEQRLLAQHLLGGQDMGLIPPDLLAAQIHDLEAQRSRAEGADDLLRTLIEAGLADGRTPDLARLRRYERTLHTRLQWYLNELRPPAPGRVEPAPIPAPASGCDETNPLLVAGVGETNPAEPDPVSTAPPPQVVAAASVAGEMTVPGPCRATDRKRRIDPARAVAQIRRANRRSV